MGPNVLAACGLALAAASALSGCGPESSQTPGSPAGCVPTQSKSCTCPLAGLGRMVCAADGTGYGPCVCSDPQSSSAAAGGSRASGAGGANGNTGGGGPGGVGGVAGASPGGPAGAPSGGAGGASAGGAAGNAAGAGGTGGELPYFSFFVTSLEAMQRLSKSQSGFGGDLRYGEADGLSGADKICTEIAEYAMPGSGAKQWRAFLSATQGGPDGGPVHAVDRIGEGPWYDRLGRIVAMTKTDLLAPRPEGADPAIKNDLPNEYGVPNHDPDGTGPVDNHDVLTGTGPDGRLWGGTGWNTCNDWTSAEGPAGMPHCGHSWPRGGDFGFGELTAAFGMGNWISTLDEAGCAPGVNLIETGPPNPANPTVGSGGGYGGIYCFALTP